MKIWFFLLLLLLLFFLLSTPLFSWPSSPEQGGEADRRVEFGGKIVADFSHYTYTKGVYNRWRGGIRCDLESLKFFTKGLRLDADFRYRYYNSEWKSSVKSIYELSLSYRPDSQGIYFKGGRFNLYNFAGVGEVDGGALGWGFSRDCLTGLYLGCEPDIFELGNIDLDYQKGGIFINYHRSGGASLVLSCNQIEFQGHTERRFLYGQAYFRLWERIYTYQHLEYELGPFQDKGLTRLFFNTHCTLTEAISVAGSYYSGRGYDYHNLLLEKIKSGQQPSTQDLEPFYWYQDLGGRLSLKLKKNQRLSLYMSLATKEEGGEILPRYGISYGINGLYQDRVGGSVSLTRTIEKDSVNSRVLLEIDGQVSERINLGFSYSNYTFKLREDDTEIFSPPDSNEWGVNLSFRINKCLFIHGYSIYIMESEPPTSCLQNYLSLVYRLK